MIAGDLVFQRRTSLSRWRLVRAILILAIFAIALALILAFQQTPETSALVAGQVSPKTILAPERTTFVTEIATRDARAKAEAQVSDVFDPPDAELAREQVRLASRVFDHIDSLRHDPYTGADQKLAWIRAIDTITLPAQTISRTVMLDENNYHRIVTETLYVLDVTMRDEIRPSSIAAEQARVPLRVSLALSADQADLVAQWARLFVIPNSFFNAQKTSDLRSQARARVGVVYRTIEKGEAVLRQGELISPQAIEALEALGILRTQTVPADYIGPALLAILLTILFVAYIARLRPALFGHSRVLLFIVLLMLASTFGIKLVANDHPVLLYLIPVSAVAMLLAVLTDSVIALGAVIVLCISTSFLSHSSLEVAVYALAGGMVSALTLGRIERVTAFLWTGAYVAATNAAVVAIFRVVARQTDPGVWAEPLVASVGNGALAGLIGVGGLFVLGKLFGITTSLELIDLARPTHPLLRKLMGDAPGTYHHSLVVSQLAEHAAQQIGADPLLVRVAAYYHDVGKILAPQMFIENQLQGANVHDTLKPEESASIVIDHVSRGLELAAKYRLPKRLADFVAQHHGTTLTAYFHRKAVRANGSDSVVEKRFRYPGPKPQSREAGILMLADSVEAAMRAEHPSSAEAIRSIVDGIVNERLRDGQLDESDLTLRDIQVTKDTFCDVLQGLYHPRVKYPDPLPPGPPKAEPPEVIRAG